MPTYDYRCAACGHEFEAFQSMSAKPLRKCPECGKLKLQRLIGTGAGVIFKGGGFWETDYRSESYKKAAEAEKKSAEPKTDAKSDAKSDKADKPAKKSDKPAKSDSAVGKKKSPGKKSDNSK